jgi:hypothetical protein
MWYCLCHGSIWARRARMSRSERGVVAAGHPLSAEAGARVLREGGNAVDAALGAMLTSLVAADRPRRRRVHAGGGRRHRADAAGLLRAGTHARGRRLGGRAGGDRGVLRRRRAGVLCRPGLLWGVRRARRGVRGVAPVGDDAARDARRARRAARPHRRRAERQSGIRGRDPRRPVGVHAGVRLPVGAWRAPVARG